MRASTKMRAVLLGGRGNVSSEGATSMPSHVHSTLRGVSMERRTQSQSQLQNRGGAAADPSTEVVAPSQSDAPVPVPRERRPPEPTDREDSHRPTQTQRSKLRQD